MFEKQTDLRQRRKLRATVKLNDGEVLEGHIFCLSKERVTDVLNDERPFLPFEGLDKQIQIIAKSTVAAVYPRDAIPDLNLSDDPYEILNVKQGDSLEEIKQAYHRRLQEYHPDRLSNFNLPALLVEVATDMTARINTAYKKIKTERAESDSETQSA